MSQVIDIKKVTIGPKDLCARVQVYPEAPLMTSDDPEGTARIKQLMPQILDHVCMGDEGEHFGDAVDNTELPHLLEHMTVELLALTNMAGDISCGRTYPVEDEVDTYDVVFPCADDVLVTSALSSAQWIMEWAYTGGGEPEPDVNAIVSGIVGLVESVGGAAPTAPAESQQEAAAQDTASDAEMDSEEPTGENDEWDVEASEDQVAAVADDGATSEAPVTERADQQAPSEQLPLQDAATASQPAATGPEAAPAPEPQSQQAPASQSVEEAVPAPADEASSEAPAAAESEVSAEPAAAEPSASEPAEQQEASPEVAKPAVDQKPKWGKENGPRPRPVR
ncbi:MAG: cyanophycin synthetase family protein [Tractidigestivibacter sp.]|jgi:hypothetical protein|uniref:cyanophycin synthetase family protein n=1 Tax=Tractidigestivibacter sp. TaxID=2847320 RepID=UPI003D93F3A8